MQRIFLLVCLMVNVTIAYSQNNIGGSRSYSNGNGAFTFSEMKLKGQDFKLCKRKLATYKRNYSTDTILYRLFPKNYWKVWNYPCYFFSSKYKLLYKKWDEIDAIRGHVRNKTGYQEF